MKRGTGIAIGIGGLSVAGILLTFFVGRGPGPKPSASADPGAAKESTQAARQEFGGGAQRRVMPPAGLFRPKPPPAAGLDPAPRVMVVEANGQGPELGVVDLDEARDLFQSALDALAEAEADPSAVDESQERVLYRRVTGAFTALSGHLDAGTPRGRRELEDANAAMKDSLGVLGIEPPPR